MPDELWLDDSFTDPMGGSFTVKVRRPTLFYSSSGGRIMLNYEYCVTGVDTSAIFFGLECAFENIPMEDEFPNLLNMETEETQNPLWEAIEMDLGVPQADPFNHTFEMFLDSQGFDHSSGSAVGERFRHKSLKFDVNSEDGSKQYEIQYPQREN